MLQGAVHNREVEVLTWRRCGTTQVEVVDARLAVEVVGGVWCASEGVWSWLDGEAGRSSARPVSAPRRVALERQRSGPLGGDVGSGPQFVGVRESLGDGRFHS